MMKKVTLNILVAIVFFMTVPEVYAQDSTPPFLSYLPLIMKTEQDTSSPWVGPEGGPIVSQAIHPANANIIYAGSWGAGVFKSEDGGETWRAKNNGLNNLYINSMAIDPYNGNILYAGTYRDKIYKTTNGGESWFQSSSGIQKDAIVYTITIDSQNADIIFIGTRGENTSGQPPWKGIVYRSTNEGINWSPVLQNVSRLGESIQDWAYDLVVNPKNHNIVFAGMHEAGVYKSVDGGNNWSPSNSGIKTDIISVRGLSINPAGSTSDALYMGTWHRDGTYKSTNNAASWSNSPLNVKVYDMDLDKVNPNILYLANFDTNNFKGGIYKTSNATGSWSLVGLGSESIYSVMVNQSQHNQVFAGTFTDGIYRSVDSGGTWLRKSQGLFSTNVSGLITIPGNAQMLVASTTSNGVSISLNRGVTWSPINSGLGSKATMGLVSDPANPNLAFVLTNNAGLFRCTLPNCVWSTNNTGVPTAAIGSTAFSSLLLDDAQKEELTLAGLDDGFVLDSKATSYKQLNQLVFAPSNFDIAYLATEGGGVLRSINHASSWTNAGLSGKIVKKLAIDPINANIVYAATNEINLVYTSNNSGNTWTSQNVAFGSCNSLSISNANPDQIYAATDQGVFTRIGTGSWSLLGLSGIVVKTIAAHPNRSGVLVAGTPSGYYFSSNNGASWSSGSSDLLGREVRIVHFDGNDSSRVYLGTSTSGAYRFYLP
ncbi:MAG: hypothetical protein BGO78_07830 [Chloroflexi bacterium 44-23]|nr:MAG: hypothetical protein BGO78_07830 [Chloroflexi bacterium 44-23]